MKAHPAGRLLTWGAALTLAALAALALPAMAAADQTGGYATADPMVKITSLAIKGDLDQIMAKINDDVCRDTGLKNGVITFYWQTFNAIYCPGCAGAKIKKPIFVDVYAPAFIKSDERVNLLKSLAAAIALHTAYGIKDIFISLRVMQKSEVYIMGDVVTNWKQVGGPDS